MWKVKRLACTERLSAMNSFQLRHALPHLSEHTFSQHIRTVQRPMLVCFYSQSCPASQALIPLLEQVTRYPEQLDVVLVDVEAEELLAELYYATAVPTLIVFQHGEPVTRLVGFVAPGLLQFLVEQIRNRSVPHEWFWKPTEEVFEDTIVVPLLQKWNLHFIRQAPCKGLADRRSSRGRIDFLVSFTEGGMPITLIENKRRIADQKALHQAVRQAQHYAHALALHVFVIAAPVGLWIYKLHKNTPMLIKSFSSLQIHMESDKIGELVLELCRQDGIA